MAKGRQLRQVVAALQQQLQREPSEAEVAAAAHADLNEVRDILQAMVAGSTGAFVSIEPEDAEAPKFLSDDTVNGEQTGIYVPAALGLMLNADGHAELVAAIDSLDVLSADILKEYYFEEKSLTDIAAARNLKEEKVKRLLDLAYAKLRKFLRDHGFEEAG